jgi:hypothetical protein
MVAIQPAPPHYRYAPPDEQFQALLSLMPAR